MSESEFLKQYNRADYLSPLITVDPVIFTFHDEQLMVLLVERGEYPEKGKWALPGGFVDEQRDTSIEETAQRKLLEKTGVKAPYLEQLRTIGNQSRDPRAWSVTVVYSALVAHQACQAVVESVTDVHWFSYQQALEMDLGFDHQAILIEARARLKQKALYSLIPAYALPTAFTLPELQQFFEVLIDKPLQKKSFRRRIEQADLIEEIGQRAATGKGRPSAVYTLKDHAKTHTFIRNLAA